MSQEKSNELKKQIEDTAEEGTRYLTELIKKEYENSSSHAINGYTIWSAPCGIITKREVKKLRIIDKDKVGVPYRECGDDDEEKMNRWVMSSMLIAYMITNNVRAAFKDYNFKKFIITSENFNEYRYCKDKFWKYRRTGYLVTFIKLDIEW